MDLVNLHVRGYRRFRDQANLKINGKVVALVGPNEAGKTTLLDAILHLDNDDPLADRDLTRGVSRDTFFIEGVFFLSPEDLAAAGLSKASWLHIRKSADGARNFEVRPSAPGRDLATRAKLWKMLNTALVNRRFRAKYGSEVADLDRAWAEATLTLQADNEDLTEAQLSSVAEVVRIIETMIGEQDPHSIREIPEAHREWASKEESKNPAARALGVLRGRIPRVFRFSEADRDLRSEYDIASLASELPAALENILLIAELRLQALLEAHAAADAASLTTLEHAANATLSRKFKESWGQSGISVRLRIQSDVLLVQVVNEKHEFTSFAERSDGLRQFVALQAFATCNWIDYPILLIDEAEQKLHYDAQADLAQMLARQEVASKVIFTTHSAGCLPEDLGNGVRLVQASRADETRSEVVNKFWADGVPGILPLLFGMGASTLAFFPTRNAVMVEGPADMLLLPSMFREALNLGVLGFQFVPGLSTSNEVIHAPALGRTNSVLFLVDGDSGGDAILKKLGGINIPADNMFQLHNRNKSAVEVEDFLDPDLLIKAVNNLLAKFHGTVAPVRRTDLNAMKRMDSLERLYRRSTSSLLPKVELAYEVLDIISDDPNVRVIDPKRRDAFTKVARAILARFTQLKDS